MQVFDRNLSNPDDQAVYKGKPVDSGVTGPYAPANTDPTSYKNQFVSQLRKNPPSKTFYQQLYSSDSAKEVQSRLDSLTDEPNFSNAGDQTLAKDFLKKYKQGVEQRGLIPQEEAISRETIAAFQSQQPGQNIGDGNVTAASKIRYPGASGTSTS